MAVVVVNKSHTYIINVLAPFTLAAGVTLAAIGSMIGTGVIQVMGRRFGRAINAIALVAIVAALAGSAASFYNDWFRRMRGGALATYEETTASILAALPKGPATVVVNPVFLLPDKRPDIRFVSAAHLLQEMDVPLASAMGVGALAPMPAAFKAGWNLPLFVLWDKDTFGTSESLSDRALAWRREAAGHFAQHCVVRSRIHTISWGGLLLYECKRAGQGRPPETPGGSEVVLGRYRLRLGEAAAYFGPGAIASWRPYKSEQTIEVDTDGLLLRGLRGAGLTTTFTHAELGLAPGDFVAIEIEVDGTRPTDMLSLQGGIQTRPDLFDSGQGGSSWHALGSRPADGLPVSIVGQITNTSPTFGAYLYSEAETSMTIKRVVLRRLIAAE